ncbi:hypothetical protein HUB97_13640 [Halorubraceae archaeon YAN]|nr:hypothetical protein [Halorubraceae archaeon YAN]
MYSLAAIQTGIKHPTLALRELNRKYYNINSGKKYNRKGNKIIDEDWDILVILDAFRYDMFSSLNTLDGSLTSKISRGSNTSEFLYGNFFQEKCLDTVYTTANPQFQKYYDKIGVEFYEFYNVWNSDRWDETLGTVHPDSMTEVSIKNIKQHPNKRHILHYLQPHYPFIDTDLESIGHDILLDNDKDQNLWGLQMRGEINLTREQIIQAYHQNCKYAFQAVESLLNSTSGKVVITSDHGNMIGERSYPIPVTEWGHPSGIYTPQLVKIPWLTIENGTRPRIYSEESIQERDEVENTIVENRLNDLGYM